MKKNDLINKWEELKTQEKSLFQRINPLHPLDFFIGINEKGFDELVLLTTTEPCQLKSSKALEVEKNLRKDGRWATQIASVEKNNQDVFASLCLDLVESSSSVKTEQEGLSLVTSRFLAWQKLFASIHETLSISTLKGLVGELRFIQYLIDKGFSKDKVIQSWQGPLGADRDFILNDNWFEIKTIPTGKNEITISSLNQLETESPGYLVIINIDETSKTDPNAISVKKIIDDMRQNLNDAPNASWIFEKNLISMGYLDKSSYEDIYFKIGANNFYHVKNDFPRLLTDEIPPEIIEVRYDISLAGIEPWKIGEESVWN